MGSTLQGSQATPPLEGQRVMFTTTVCCGAEPTSVLKFVVTTDPKAHGYYWTKEEPYDQSESKTLLTDDKGVARFEVSRPANSKFKVKVHATTATTTSAGFGRPK